LSTLSGIPDKVPPLVASVYTYII